MTHPHEKINSFVVPGMGVRRLGGLHGDTSVPDLWTIQDRAGRGVSRHIQCTLSLPVGGLHRLGHYRLLDWTRR